MKYHHNVPNVNFKRLRPAFRVEYRTLKFTIRIAELVCIDVAHECNKKKRRTSPKMWPTQNGDLLHPRLVTPIFFFDIFCFSTRNFVWNTIQNQFRSLTIMISTHHNRLFGQVRSPDRLTIIIVFFSKLNFEKCCSYRFWHSHVLAFLPLCQRNLRYPRYATQKRLTGLRTRRQ